MGTFGFEDCDHIGRTPDQARMPMGVHNVVEVSWAASFCQCPEFLSQQFGQRIAPRVGQGAIRTVLHSIAEGMEHWTKLECTDNCLVSSEVDLHLGGSGYSKWPDVSNSAFEGGVSSLVHSLAKGLLVQDESQAALGGDPFGDLPEPIAKRGNAEISLRHCEVQILRKPISLEPALAKTCTALERPRHSFRVLGNASQEPTEDIVLLDDALGKLPLASRVGDFTFGDHADTSAFTRRPQRVDRGPSAGNMGSRSAIPEVIGQSIASMSMPRTSKR